MKILNRNPENCALLFAWFEGLFLFNFLSVPFAIFVFHWFMLVTTVAFLVFVVVFGLLAYQIEYHPLIAVIWSAGLFLPYASLIVILVLFIQTKSYLRKKNYKIGLWGARLNPPEAAAPTL
jgi:hypothetical protein